MTDRVEYMRRWREENADKIKASAAAWRAKNAEHVKEREKQRPKRPYNRKTQQKALEKWRKANKAYTSEANKKWREENPIANAEKARRYNARKKAVLVESFTVDQLNARMAEFHNQCVYCAGPFEHVDHAVPLSRGGAHALFNLVPACAHCNVSKGTKTHLEFMSEIRR